MTIYHQNLTDKIVKSGISYPNIFKKMPADMSNYLDHFDLPYNDAKYEGGYLKVGIHQIFLQTFTPPEFQKTAFLFHGYFDHGGYFSNVVSLLLKKGIRVVVWDQPGYGLSSGERAFCNTFEDYIFVAEAIIQKFVENESAGPHLFIGHSAGCAQILSLICNRKIDQQDKIIFIAPLIHCTHWKLVTFMMSLLGSFLKKVPRKLKRVSNDQEFIKKIRSDHLEGRSVHLSWPKALIQWEKTLVEMKTPIVHILVLQGDLDDTVDWRYNMKWLEGKFSNLEKVMFKGGRHHLHNEAPELLQKVLKAIESYL